MTVSDSLVIGFLSLWQSGFGNDSERYDAEIGDRKETIEFPMKRTRSTIPADAYPLKVFLHDSGSSGTWQDARVYLRKAHRELVKQGDVALVIEEKRFFWVPSISYRLSLSRQGNYSKLHVLKMEYV